MGRFHFGAIVLASGIAATPAAADAVADFYKDKLVTITVGATAGGGTDSYARALAPLLSKHLPGHPTVIVQNKWGAGGANAASWFANAAPQDGTAILLPLAAVPLNQVLKAAGAKYDMAKFRWIGRMADEPKVLIVWRTVATSIEDTRKKEILMSASGAGSTSYYIPKIVGELLGAKFKIVKGYKGVHNMLFAIEQGEVQGTATALNAIVQRTPHFLKDNKVSVLMAFHRKRIPSLPDVPLASELARNDRERRILELISGPDAFGRSLALTRDTPAARVAAMRTAFTKAMHDPAYLASAAKYKLDVNYASGEDVQKIVEDIVNVPTDIAAAARELIGSQ